MTNILRNYELRSELIHCQRLTLPAAGQISYRLYDRSNFVTDQRRPVMTGWPVITQTQTQTLTLTLILTPTLTRTLILSRKHYTIIFTLIFVSSTYTVFNVIR